METLKTKISNQFLTILFAISVIVFQLIAFIGWLQILGIIQVTPLPLGEPVRLQAYAILVPFVDALFFWLNITTEDIETSHKLEKETKE